MANVFIVTAKNTTRCVGGDGWNGTACAPGGHELSSAEIALWGLITLIGIAGMIYGLMNVFGMA